MDVLENSRHYNFSVSPQNDTGDTIMGDIHGRTNLSYELLAHVRAYADKADETSRWVVKANDESLILSYVSVFQFSSDKYWKRARRLSIAQ